METIYNPDGSVRKRAEEPPIPTLELLVDELFVRVRKLEGERRPPLPPPVAARTVAADPVVLSTVELAVCVAFGLTLVWAVRRLARAELRGLLEELKCSGVTL